MKKINHSKKNLLEKNQDQHQYAELVKKKHPSRKKTFLNRKRLYYLMDYFSIKYYTQNMVSAPFFRICFVLLSLNFFIIQACSPAKNQKNIQQELAQQLRSQQENQNMLDEDKSESFGIGNLGVSCYMNTMLKLLWKADRFQKLTESEINEIMVTVNSRDQQNLLTRESSTNEQLKFETSIEEDATDAPVCTSPSNLHTDLFLKSYNALLTLLSENEEHPGRSIKSKKDRTKLAGPMYDHMNATRRAYAEEAGQQSPSIFIEELIKANYPFDNKEENPTFSVKNVSYIIENENEGSKENLKKILQTNTTNQTLEDALQRKFSAEEKDSLESYKKNLNDGKTLEIFKSCANIASDPKKFLALIIDNKTETFLEQTRQTLEQNRNSLTFNKTPKDPDENESPPNVQIVIPPSSKSQDHQKISDLLKNFLSNPNNSENKPLEIQTLTQFDSKPKNFGDKFLASFFRHPIITPFEKIEPATKEEIITKILKEKSFDPLINSFRFQYEHQIHYLSIEEETKNPPKTILINIESIRINSDGHGGKTLNHTNIEPDDIVLSFYKRNQPSQKDAFYEAAKATYRLQGAGVHHGGVNGGHWNAYLKEGDGNHTEWFHHDDSRVYQVEERTVMEEIRKKGTFFLYKRIEESSSQAE